MCHVVLLILAPYQAVVGDFHGINTLEAIQPTGKRANGATGDLLSSDDLVAPSCSGP